jgi:hypothetical protein
LNRLPSEPCAGRDRRANDECESAEVVASAEQEGGHEDYGGQRGIAEP